MPTRSVDLNERLNPFIESGVASGRFRNANEAVQEGLNLLEHSEAEDLVKLL